jgi:thermostable 8-oxoguanine DNA glycosylase
MRNSNVYIIVSFAILLSMARIWTVESAAENCTSSFSSRIEKKNLSLKTMEQDTAELLVFCEIAACLIPPETQINGSTAKYSARLEEKLGALVNESLDGSAAGLQHSITQPMIMDLIQPKSHFSEMDETEESTCREGTKN